ncbi:MAG TPA: universal stress protein [Blastocatellia bacterium]|nr:universal stress protein [Blastocatellia bacterium]
MIKTILVATDFSEHAQRALERAIDLAGQVGARVYLLHIQTEGALRMALREGLLSATSSDEEIREAVAQLIEERFSQAQSGIDRSQTVVEHCSRRGEAGVLIPAYAEEIGADLVVLGRRGAGLIGEVRAAVIGSVTASVIRRSPCPVMVVRREHRGIESLNH